MSRTILILGAGVMQLPSIRAARRLGARVVVADANRDAVGIPEADEFLPVDLKDHEAMAEAAADLRARDGLDAVFTAGTDFSATVAFVAERLGLPGTSFESALNATDKFRMRSVLRSAGVRVPDFAVVTAEQLAAGGLASVRSAVELPVVVKPVDSMGARGVVRADRWDEAEAFAADAVSYSRSGRVVVEGYIDGPEFSLDAIVYGDDVQITGFADRHIFFPPYFIELGHTLPTSASQTDVRAIEAEFRSAIRALGIGPGAAKGDVKLSPEGPVIGEVAARLSGGYMSGWTYPLASGVPLSEIALRVALGEAPPRARPAWNRVSAERAAISIPGALREIRGASEAVSTRFVEELFLTRRPADRVRFPRNNVEKVANVIATAASRDEAVAAAESAVRGLEPILEPRVEETDRFLFDPPDRLPPEERHRAFGEAGSAGAPGAPEWDAVARGVGEGPVVVQLPDDLLTFRGRDWAYRTIEESIAMLGEAVRVAPLAPGATPPDKVSALFIAALVKGGLQGARYVVESLRAGN